MESLRRILVGLDGLAPAEHAIRYAAMIGRLGCSARRDEVHHRATCAPLAANRYAPTTTAEICLADAARPTTSDTFAEFRFVALLRHLGRVEPPPRISLLRMVNDHFAPPGIAAVSCDLLRGRPLERLPRLASDFDADLLVLDTDCDSRRKSARVASEAPCPVWLVPGDVAPVLRRILVPVDFSQRSATCFRTALRLAEKFPPAKCVALHVAPYHGRLDDAIDVASESELSEQFASFMEGIDPRGVAVEPLFVKAARFAGAVQRTVRECSIDLTVMTARRRNRLTSSVLPSRAHAAIRATTCPFLILKSGATALTVAEALHERLRDTDPPQFA